MLLCKGRKIMVNKNKWVKWGVIISGVFFTLCVGCCSITAWYGSKADVAEEGMEGETVFRLNLASEHVEESKVKVRGEGEVGFNEIEIPAKEREMPAALAFDNTRLFGDRDITLSLEIDRGDGWERLPGVEGTYREDEPSWMMNDDFVVEVLDEDSAKMRGMANFDNDLIEHGFTEVAEKLERGAVDAAIREYRGMQRFVRDEEKLAGMRNRVINGTSEHIRSLLQERDTKRAENHLENLESVMPESSEIEILRIEVEEGRSEVLAQRIETALSEGEILEATELLEQLQNIEENHERIDEFSTELFEEQLSAMEVAIGEYDRERAETLYEAVAEESPEHPEVVRFQDDIEHLQRLGELKRESSEAARRGELETAQDKLEELHRVDSDYPAIDELEQEIETLEEQNFEERLETIKREGLEAVAAENVGVASEKLEDLRRLDDDYQGIVHLEEALDELEAAITGVGDVVTFDDSKWTVLDAEDRGSTLESTNRFLDDMTSQGRFIYVKFQVENLKNSEARVLNSPSIRDSQRREFNQIDRQSLYLPDNAKTMTMEAIPATMSREFHAIYEVAADSEGIEFLARDFSAFGTSIQPIVLGF